jgi:hypothetical protein
LGGQNQLINHQIECQVRGLSNFFWMGGWDLYFGPDIYSPPPLLKMIPFPFSGHLVFQLLIGLFALILPYFAFILPLYFPFFCFCFLFLYFLLHFPLFLFPFSYFFTQISADIPPPPGGYFPIYRTLGGGGEGETKVRPSGAIISYRLVVISRVVVYCFRYSTSEVRFVEITDDLCKVRH